jgi:hypothetical protein
VAAGDEAHQPAGAHQVEGAAEEVVVDAEAGIGPVAHVGDLVLAEGDVADHQVEPVVGQRSFSNGDAHVHAAGRVERLEDAAGNPVDLDGGDAAALGQIPRHGADEVADAGGGFQDAPAGEAEALHRLPYRLDHVDLGVVAVVDGGARRFVVLGGSRACKRRARSAQALSVGFEVEAGGQAAPAGVALKNLALIRTGRPALGFDLAAEA